MKKSTVKTYNKNNLIEILLKMFSQEYIQMGPLPSIVEHACAELYTGCFYIDFDERMIIKKAYLDIRNRGVFSFDDATNNIQSAKSE